MAPTEQDQAPPLTPGEFWPLVGRCCARATFPAARCGTVARWVSPPVALDLPPRRENAGAAQLRRGTAMPSSPTLLPPCTAASWAARDTVSAWLIRLMRCRTISTETVQPVARPPSLSESGPLGLRSGVDSGDAVGVGRLDGCGERRCSGVAGYPCRLASGSTNRARVTTPGGAPVASRRASTV